MKQVNLNLNVNEVNAILQSLGKMSYVEVHQLVQKIQLQAAQQLNEQPNGSASKKDKVKKKETAKV